MEAQPPLAFSFRQMLTRRNVHRAGFVVTSVLTAIFLLSIAGWIRSYSRIDVLLDPSGLDQYAIVAQADGSILLGDEAKSGSGHFAFPRGQGLGIVGWMFITGDRPTKGWGANGFAYFAMSDAMEGEQQGWAFVFPYWVITVISAPAPAGWLIRKLIRRRRTSVGSCPVCGYDLRQSPKRCPECGTIRPT